MSVETLPIPELNPEAATVVAMKKVRSELVGLTGEAYTAKFDEWARLAQDLAEKTPIIEGRGGILEMELPGDYRSVHVAFDTADRWLNRAIHDRAIAGRLQEFLLASRELTNNEFEHSLKLLDPESRERLTKAGQSVWLGFVLTYRDSEPIVETLLETTGTVPPREILDQYFEVHEEDDGDRTHLELTPKSSEDIYPSQVSFDELDLDTIQLGGRGFQTVAGLMEPDDLVELTYPSETRNPSEEPVPHTTRLRENLVA